MSISITLSGNSSILSENFFPPIELMGSYVCGLINFTTFNSIPNIDINNNLFHIGDHIIEIPIGSYELEDIATYLKSTIQELDPNANFLISANNNTLRTELTSSLSVDFSHPRSIGKLLGFNPCKIIPNDGSEKTLSNLPINITNLNTIRVECNIATGSYINNMSAHTIHEFSPDVPPGYKIIETPTNVIYFPINTRQINNLTIKVVDQEGELINFRGEKITLRLHFKRVEI